MYMSGELWLDGHLGLGLLAHQECVYYGHSTWGRGPLDVPISVPLTVMQQEQETKAPSLCSVPSVCSTNKVEHQSKKKCLKGQAPISQSK